MITLNKAVDYIIWLIGFMIGLAVAYWNYKHLLGLVGFALFVWGIYEMFKRKTVKNLGSQLAIVFSGFMVIVFWYIFT